MRARAGVFGFVLACGLPAGSACTGIDSAQAEAAPQPEPRLRVRLAPVEHGPWTRSVRVSGTISAKSEAELAFKVGGVVTSVAVDEGARVHKGQVLATLDDTEYLAAQVQSRQGVLKAERDLARVRTLLESGAVGVVDVQNAQTATELARAQTSAAEFNLRHAQLVAPDDGIVDRRSIEVGEIVAPGRPAFQLRGASRGVVVRCALTDRDALALKLGDPARVTLDARPEEVLPARFSRLATAASPATGMFEVELRLGEPDAAQLPSGLTAKVEFDRREPAGALVPVGALVDGDGDSAAVFVVEGDRAKRVPVRVGRLWSDRASIVSGLAQATAVVELGAAQLEDGSSVQVEP